MDLGLMFISAILMMVIVCPMMLSKKAPFRHKSEDIISEAKQAGRTAVGTLIGTRFLPGEPGHKNPLDRESRWLGTYTYDVNGKRYSIGVSSTDQLPQTLTVYYPAGRPDKGITELNYLVGGKAIVNALIPIVVWAIIFEILNIITG